MDAPKAARAPHEVSTVFGAQRNDPYFWLRDDTRSSPQVIAYLKTENAYTNQVLEPMKGLRTEIRNEIASRVPARDSSVPLFGARLLVLRAFRAGSELSGDCAQEGVI